MEMRDALSHLGIVIVTPQEKGITEVPEETGDTFKANAEQKARFYFKKTGLPTLADDSGIIVEALESELGIHTRRWGAGKDATDKQWIEFFLERMSHETNKHAHFLCVLAYIDRSGALKFFEGKSEGIITDSLEAEYLPGLPLSACFRPNGSGEVFSALSLEEKAKISHRGRALEQFKEFMIQAA